MKIYETLEQAKAVLYHPVVNQRGKARFICHAVAEVTGTPWGLPSREDADRALRFLADNFGLDIRFAGSGKQFNHYAVNCFERDSGPDQQTARHEVLRCAIHLAKRLGW
jgi:hypothetical protein